MWIIIRRWFSKFTTTKRWFRYLKFSFNTIKIILNASVCIGYCMFCIHTMRYESIIKTKQKLYQRTLHRIHAMRMRQTFLRFPAMTVSHITIFGQMVKCTKITDLQIWVACLHCLRSKTIDPPHWSECLLCLNGFASCSFFSRWYVLVFLSLFFPCVFTLHVSWIIII